MKFTIDSFKDVGRNIVKDPQKHTAQNGGLSSRASSVPKSIEIHDDEDRRVSRHGEAHTYCTPRRGSLLGALQMDTKDLQGVTPSGQVELMSPRVGLSSIRAPPYCRLPWATPRATMAPSDFREKTRNVSKGQQPKEFVRDAMKMKIGAHAETQSEAPSGDEILSSLRRRISQSVDGGDRSLPPLSQAGNSIVSSLQPTPRIARGLAMESGPSIVKEPHTAVAEQLQRASEKAKKHHHLVELAGRIATDDNHGTQYAAEEIVLPQFSDFDTPPETPPPPGERRKSLLDLLSDGEDQSHLAVQELVMPLIKAPSPGIVSKSPSSRQSFASSSQSSDMDFEEERQAMDGPFGKLASRRKSDATADVAISSKKAANSLLTRRKSESDIPEVSAPAKASKPWTKLQEALEQLKPRGKQILDYDTFIFSGSGVLWDIDIPQWIEEQKNLDEVRRKCIDKVNGLISKGKRVIFLCNSPQQSQRSYLQEILRRGIEMCDGADQEALHRAERNIVSVGRTCACFLQACAVRKPLVFTSHYALVEDLQRSGAFEDVMTTNDSGGSTVEAFSKDPNTKNICEAMELTIGADAIVVGYDRDPTNMKLVVAARHLASNEDTIESAVRVPFVACCSHEWKRKLKWLWNRSTCQSLTGGVRVDPEVQATDVRFPSGCLLCALATAEEYGGYGVDLSKSVYIGCDGEAVEFAAQGGMECLLVMNSVVTKMELKSLRAKGIPMPAWILPTFADEV